MGLLTDFYNVTPTGMLTNYLGETFGPAVISASDQAATIDAIHTYIAGTQPGNGEARKIQNDWLAWYGQLSWLQKNTDDTIALEAYNRRNAFMRANATNNADLQKINNFLKGVPVVNPVTGKPTLADANGDRVIPPKPLIPPQYKVVAVATAAGVAVLVLLKKLYII